MSAQSMDDHDHDTSSAKSDADIAEQNDRSVFPFLQLPGEIRNQIYVDCFENGHTEYRSLFRVCRQMQHEYLPLHGPAGTALVSIHEIDDYVEDVSSPSAVPFQDINICTRGLPDLRRLGQNQITINLIPLLLHCHSANIRRCRFLSPGADRGMHNLFEPTSPLMTFLKHIGLPERVEVFQITARLVPMRSTITSWCIPLYDVRLRVSYNPMMVGVNPDAIRLCLFRSIHDGFDASGTAFISNTPDGYTWYSRTGPHLSSLEVEVVPAVNHDLLVD
jgi:hypothetical protein